MKIKLSFSICFLFLAGCSSVNDIDYSGYKNCYEIKESKLKISENELKDNHSSIQRDIKNICNNSNNTCSNIKMKLNLLDSIGIQENINMRCKTDMSKFTNKEKNNKFNFYFNESIMLKNSYNHCYSNLKEIYKINCN